MRRLIFAIFLLCLFAWNTAEAGVLRTRDGRVFEGTLRFETAGWVQVVPKSQNEFPLSFKLADIAALTLRTPLSGVVSGGTLPGNWGVQDLGATSTVGSADYAAGEFTLRGEGTALGSITDACHFVYHRLPARRSIQAIAFAPWPSPPPKGRSFSPGLLSMPLRLPYRRQSRASPKPRIG
jgi:hypothetical protein